MISLLALSKITQSHINSSFVSSELIYNNLYSGGGLTRHYFAYKNRFEKVSSVWLNHDEELSILSYFRIKNLRYHYLTNGEINQKIIPKAPDIHPNYSGYRTITFASKDMFDTFLKIKPVKDSSLLDQQFLLNNLPRLFTAVELAQSFKTKESGTKQQEEFRRILKETIYLEAKESGASIAEMTQDLTLYLSYHASGFMEFSQEGFSTYVAKLLLFLLRAPDEARKKSAHIMLSFVLEKSKGNICTPKNMRSQKLIVL